jgi:hypothetical protein
VLAGILGIMLRLAWRHDLVLDLRLILHELNRGDLPGWRWRNQEEESKNETDHQKSEMK